MTQIQKTALVPYKAQEMFVLVNDIESYPQFLPWCQLIDLQSKTEIEPELFEVIASIQMGTIGLKQRFSTINQIKTDQWIKMNLLKGPFSHLQGRWDFYPLGEDGSKISLDISFEISNRLLRLSLDPIFTKITSNLIDSFIERAKELYGKK
ncbi:MAG: type II toxin-antitoxin system RatA family toxin [Thiomargarita sp.]|nr:type II toxin-antitoxin system RatA family toxin [Thiomargarita sp.]